MIWLYVLGYLFLGLNIATVFHINKYTLEDVETVALFFFWPMLAFLGAVMLLGIGMARLFRGYVWLLAKIGVA